MTYIFYFPHNFGFQERQGIIKYWLDNLRAKQGEVLHNIHFLEGQPISKVSFVMITLFVFPFSLPYLDSISTLCCGFYMESTSEL